VAEPKKKPNYSNAWQEARELIWHHRRRLGVGLLLMLVNRLAGLVLPASSKYLIDHVIGQRRVDLLGTIALAAGAATLVQAVTSFGLSQILGIAAQRAITEMRKAVQAFVLRLPIAYFDSTKTGVLISRIMTDAEGIRNLVGTGLVQLAGVAHQHDVRVLAQRRPQRRLEAPGVYVYLALLAGTGFGPAGAGHLRLSFAAPADAIDRALERLGRCVAELGAP
jgi:ABC-type multidrug transport system fused ATPase/permease subunit